MTDPDSPAPAPDGASAARPGPAPPPPPPEVGSAAGPGAPPPPPDDSPRPPIQQAVLLTSGQQLQRHAVAGARTLREQAAWFDLRRLGAKGSIRTRLSVTDDKMLYCHAAKNGAMLWCAYLGAPNQLALRYGELWFTRVGGVDLPDRRANPFRVTFYSAFGATSPWTTRSRITAVFLGRSLRAFLGTLGVEPIVKAADLRRDEPAA